MKKFIVTLTLFAMLASFGTSVSAEEDSTNQTNDEVTSATVETTEDNTTADITDETTEVNTPTDVTDETIVDSTTTDITDAKSVENETSSTVDEADGVSDKPVDESVEEIDFESLLGDLDNFNSLDEDSKAKLIDYIVDSYQEMEEVLVTEEESTIEAGLTPDSFFYFLDRMVENVQLSLTSDSVEKAKLLTQIALERLEELNSLDEEKKLEYMNNLVGDYYSSLEDASQAVEDAGQQGQDVSEVVEELEEVVKKSENIELPNTGTEEGNEEIKEQLESVKEIIVRAKVVMDVPTENVTALRKQGLGYGQIALINKIANASGTSIEEVITTYQENQDIGNTIKALGMHPSELNSKGKKAKDKKVKEDLDDNEEEVSETTEEMNSLTEENVDSEADEDIEDKDDEDKEDAQKKLAKKEKFQEKEQEKKSSKEAKVEDDKDYEDDDDDEHDDDDDNDESEHNIKEKPEKQKKRKK